MKKTIFCILLLSVLFSATAVPYLTTSEIDVIKKLTDDNIKYTCISSEEALSASTQQRTESLEYAEKNNFSEQAKLIIDNIMSVEVHTHMYEINMKDPEIKTHLLPRIQKATDWIEKHKKESGISAYMYYTTANIISCGLSFMSLSEIVSYGLKVKDYFVKATEIDPTSSFAYFGLAQWYYHAPGISGGSKKKAYSNFELSFKYATTTSEKFYANIYMSQSLFDQKKYADVNKYLDEAEKMLPGNKLVSFIRKLNDAGYCYIYYMANREEVEKKLKNKL